MLAHWVTSVPNRPAHAQCFLRAGNRPLPPCALLAEALSLPPWLLIDPSMLCASKRGTTRSWSALHLILSMPFMQLIRSDCLPS